MRWGQANRFNTRAALMAGVAAALLWTAPASAQERQRYDIPAGEASQAVQRLAVQSGVQVMAPNADLSGITTNPVNGDYTPVEALRRMLADKGLEVVAMNDGTVVIRRPTQETAGDVDEGPLSDPDASDIVVTGSRIRRPGFDTLEATLVTDAEEFRRRAYTNVIQALNDTPGFVPSDVNTIGTGQNSLTAGQNFADFFGLGSQRTLTLVNGRRFVSSNTIAGSGGANGAGGQVDLNLIPAGLTERVETVAIGGAPIYGADAISGTVNIILRDDFEGVTGTAQYGITERGDGAGYTFRGLAGTNFANDRGNITLSAEYNEQSGLLQGERTGRPFFTPDPDGPADFTVFRDLTYNFITDGGLPLLGFGNITDAQGQALQFSNNQLVPYVQGFTFNGVEYDGGDGFRFADHRSLLAPTERLILNGLGHFDITPSIKLFVEASYAHSTGRELSELASVTSPIFGNPLSVSIDNAFLSDQARNILIANGVTDSFTLARNLSDILDRGGDYSKNRVELYRIVTGLEGTTSLFGEAAGWDVSVNYGRSESKTTTKYVNSDRFLFAVDAVRDGGGNIVCAASLDPDAAVRAAAAGCAPINLFGENVFSDEAGEYVIDRGSAISLNEQFVATANFNSALPIRIASQPITFNIGAEYREEKASFETDEILSNPSTLLGFTFIGPYQAFPGSYNTKEVYGELSVPLISPDQNVPLIKSLNVEGAARYVDNSLTGGDLTWSAGGRFSPRLPGVLDGITFRGVYTRAIRAPAITELFSPRSSTRGGIADPCDPLNIDDGVNPTVRAANCAAALQAVGVDPEDFNSTTDGVSAQGFISGNANLDNETAKSWSVGLVYQPPVIRGLRIAADWSEIRLTGGIQSLGIGDLIDACYDSPNFPNEPSCAAFDRLTAAEAAAQPGPDRVAGDIADGYTSGYVNVASIDFAGLIIAAEYSFGLDSLFSSAKDAGTVSLGAKLFHYDKFELRASAASEPVSSVGSSGVPKWSGQFNIAYAGPALDLSLQALWTGPAKNDILATSEDIPDVENNIETYWRFNGTVGFRVKENFRFQVAVNNLFDRKPSNAQLNSENYSRYDILGRSFIVTATAGF